MDVRRKELNELMTLAETCKLLNVHPNTLRSWDKKGILKAIRFGVRGDRRYNRIDVEKLVSGVGSIYK